jgi:hypothetical protein
MTTAQVTAVVIDANGHFGSHATVWFTGNMKQCQAFAKRGGCQILTGCDKAKGDKIARGVLADMVSAGRWSRA